MVYFGEYNTRHQSFLLWFRIFFALINGLSAINKHDNFIKLTIHKRTMIELLCAVRTSNQEIVVLA